MTLQATLINELAYIEQATVNLVVGVPSFAFKDTLDPIAIQQRASQLSAYFQEGSRTAYGFSNALVTQQARMSEYRHRAPEPPTEGDSNFMDAAQDEDLFIYTLENVSLNKYEQMVVTVAEFELPYEDIYTLDLPFGPPREVRREFQNQQQAELARLFAAPKVMHEIRLTNSSKYPLTTAPALILQNGRLIAQGMMTYTSIGADTDLELTAAINIQVGKTSREVERIANAEKWRNNTLDRVNLEGAIQLTNRTGQTVKIEVRRHVLGVTDTADHAGKMVQLNLEEEGCYATDGGYPYWWGWHHWGPWWYHFNRMGKFEWTCTLEPGQSVDLNYTWHYIWG